MARATSKKEGKFAIHIPIVLLLVLALALSFVHAAAVDLYGSNITSSTSYRWSGLTTLENDTTEGGNMTDLDVGTGTSLTDKWAAYYGNVTGFLVAGNATDFVYRWTWNVSNGNGAICLSTNSSLMREDYVGANGSEIDTAWSFSPTDTDSGNNTFEYTNCTIDIGSTSIDNASYVDNGAAGGFMTCALKKNGSTPTEGDMLFCVELSGGAAAWSGETVNYEIMVPTTEGVATETYYFYLNLG